MRDLFGNVHQTKPTKQGSRKPKHDPALVGCEHCPQNTNSKVVKIKGLVRIGGRKAMLWGQSPGRQENQVKKELVGASGEFLWQELKAVGLTRDDFDVQCVMRCWPIDRKGNEHDPTKQELQCCSIYNDEALRLNREKAHVHLILGKVAGVQLLGRAYKKDNPIFWHEPWNAYVVLADHPSYLLRSGGKKAGWIYYTFRDRIKGVKSILDHPGKYGYIYAQDYKPVFTLAEMDELEKEIREFSQAGNNVTVDIEDGEVEGKPNTVLVIGFGMTTRNAKTKGYQGKARVVVLHHPEGKQSPKRIRLLLKRIKVILEDPTIKKSLQHGSYDEDALWEQLQIRIRGYNFDSQYGAYLWKSHLRTYSLASLARFFFPEFADYKDMMAPYSGNFAKAPLKLMVAYNGGDCDLTKRVELLVGDKISKPLLEIYIRVARVLGKMGERGPYLDKQNWTRVSEVVGPYIKKMDRDLQRIAGDLNFNPSSAPQVAALLYDKLKLPMPEEGRSVGALVLETMAANDKGGGLPKMIILRRQLGKVESTYLKGYLRSAEKHGGQLRTIWWLTGAATGRLRSGGGDETEAEGIINFQNFHGNALLENILVSDPNWRIAL